MRRYCFALIEAEFMTAEEIKESEKRRLYLGVGSIFFVAGPYRLFLFMADVTHST
jgi:hypothetical protein